MLFSTVLQTVLNILNNNIIFWWNKDETLVEWSPAATPYLANTHIAVIFISPTCLGTFQVLIHNVSSKKRMCSFLTKQFSKTFQYVNGLGSFFLKFTHCRNMVLQIGWNFVSKLRQERSPIYVMTALNDAYPTYLM